MASTTARRSLTTWTCLTAPSTCRAHWWMTPRRSPRACRDLGRCCARCRARRSCGRRASCSAHDARGALGVVHGLGVPAGGPAALCARGGRTASSGVPRRAVAAGPARQDRVAADDPGGSRGGQTRPPGSCRWTPPHWPPPVRAFRLPRARRGGGGRRPPPPRPPPLAARTPPPPLGYSPPTPAPPPPPRSP